MRNESAAILDIHSDEVSFLLGSRGVNGTFVFSGSHTEKYDGYSIENGFFDINSFRQAVNVAIMSVRQNYNGLINEVYVGVPSGFISVQTKGHTMSYPSKRKITQQDVDALYENGLNELLAQGECIRHSAMYFELGDNRRYFSVEDLYGLSTTMLKGALCYYFVSDSFYETMNKLLRELGITTVHYIPSTLAQSMYLLPEKRRDGYAFLLDIGFMTSSISVVYGNGIVHEESFDCGVGEILADIAEKLHVDYYTAEEILYASNVSGGNVMGNVMWTNEQGDLSIPVNKINEIIKNGLDVLCEDVENFFAKYYKEKFLASMMVNPISITGEGIGYIKGATEHISKRINRLPEIVYPDLPFYDKPMFSSRISLLDMALSDKKKRGWFYKIFNSFGGKRS